MIEINNKTRSRINSGMVRKITEAFLKKHKLAESDLSIAFVGDTVMERLNKIYRGKNGPTDILSFEGEARNLGELVIDYAQIKRQAKSFSDSADQELAFILVHGLLHLMGHTDETEAKRKKMVRLGENFIASLKTKKYE